MSVVVFDFDGVIIPSEEIKQNGYRWMFSEFGEDVPEAEIRAAREEFSNAKGNRYDIIRSIFARLGRAGDIEETVATYAERFGAVVEKKLASFQVESKVRTMLERLARTHVLYINSNTPDAPLREILKSLQIESMFKGILGSSRGVSKVERLREIAAQEGVTNKELVFVGDGEGDLEAAREFGCEFIGIATDLNGWKNGTAEFKVLESVAEYDKKSDRGGERMV